MSREPQTSQLSVIGLQLAATRLRDTAGFGATFLHNICLFKFSIQDVYILIENGRWSFGGILVRLIRKCSLRKLSRKPETSQFSVIELKLAAMKMFVGARTLQFTPFE